PTFGAAAAAFGVIPEEGPEEQERRGRGRGVAGGRVEPGEVSGGAHCIILRRAADRPARSTLLTPPSQSNQFRAQTFRPSTRACLAAVRSSARVWESRTGPT